MILEPGSFSGIDNSPNPLLGPEDKNLISFDILNKLDARLFRVADKLTKLVCSDKDTNLSSADLRFNLK
jgi:hypothetical protein